MPVVSFVVVGFVHQSSSPHPSLRWSMMMMMMTDVSVPMHSSGVGWYDHSSPQRYHVSEGNYVVFPYFHHDRVKIVVAFVILVMNHRLVMEQFLDDSRYGVVVPDPIRDPLVVVVVRRTIEILV